MRQAASALVAGGALAVLVGLLFGPAGRRRRRSRIDLYAVTGTPRLPGGQVVTVWGYNSTNAQRRPGPAARR